VRVRHRGTPSCFSVNRESKCHGIGTPLARRRDACWRRLVGVYLSLPATAAVADMPVGAPPPFASALEPSSGRTRTNGARSGSPGRTSAVQEPLASHLSQPLRRARRQSGTAEKLGAPSNDGLPFGASAELCTCTRKEVGSLPEPTRAWHSHASTVDPGRHDDVRRRREPDTRGQIMVHQALWRRR